METLGQDLKYGMRTLGKNPGFTAVAVLTLALGIGANTAIFSVVNGILLRSLPYKNPGQLVKLWGKFDKAGIPKNWISEPEWWDLQEANQVFSDLAAYSPTDGANAISSSGEPVRVAARSATASLFPLLGVEAARGRAFTPDEDQPGRNRVVVLSDGAWKTLYGADPNLMGKSVRIDAQTYTIVGVLPAGFNFGGRIDVWMPLGLDRAHPDDRGDHNDEVVGRLKPGITLTQASAEIAALAARLDRTYPDFYRDQGFGMFLVPLREEVVGDVRPALLTLLGAVGLVLLIACGNIANLLLARATAREKEIAIRAALGADRWRLSRQLLTESVLLALCGGGLGLLMAFWAVDAMHSLAREILPRLAEVRVDPVALGFAFGVSVLTGLLFGLAPALHFASSQPQSNLTSEARGASASAGRQRFRNALVVSEIALSLLLLICAGLLLRSFDHLLKVSPGFNTDRVLSMQLSLPETKYKDGSSICAFYRRLLERVRALPGVEFAGAVHNLPLSGSYSSGGVTIEDTAVTDVLRDPRTHRAYLEADWRPTTPGYFEAMRIPLVEGRLFTDADDAQAPLVTIVDIDFANRFWPGQDPIGKRVVAVGREWRTIVGVVGHVKHYALNVKGREQIYFPQNQSDFNIRDMFLVARTSGDPAALTNAIRQEVMRLDPEQPVYAVKTMEELLDASVAQPRLNLFLLGLFAGLALLLAAVGIYGVLAYSVTQRTREIGIRLALGAEPSDALMLVVRQGLALALTGIALGLAGSLLITRFISTLLFGVTPTDPFTYAAVSGLLLMVALAASYIPALRATRVDPIVALRYE
jgi:putative ABC transport system permease protein